MYNKSKEQRRISIKNMSRAAARTGYFMKKRNRTLQEKEVVEF